MKITFNTSQPSAAASVFYHDAFLSLKGCSLYNRDYSQYDIALFMTYDHGSIKSIKEKFPHLKIGIIDPRVPEVSHAINYCDFIVVDGVEMEDFWRFTNRPIFRYIEYPNIKLDNPTYTFTKQPDTIYIGYHGNPLHIMEGDQSLSPALSRLSKNTI